MLTHQTGIMLEGMNERTNSREKVRYLLCFFALFPLV